MLINEANVKLRISSEKKITKKLSVFYNPVMKLNRDISVLLLKAIKDKNMQIALPLAGSGVRGLRFLKELNKNKIKNISFNDYKTIKNIKTNLRLNELEKNKKVQLFNKDANQFLLESKGFDYIDIDPFGSPNDFLNTSIVRLSRKGILAVTATDTAALCGTSPNACKRKYWAKPLRNEFMHESGIRILIRKIQLIGAQNDKALTPIFSYSKDHYFRIFFRCDKGKQKADSLLQNHAFILFCNKCLNRYVSKYNKGKCICKNEFDFIGPLWIGKLWDVKLIVTMIEEAYPDSKMLEFLLKIKGEADVFEMSKDIPVSIVLNEFKNKEELLEITKKNYVLAAATYYDINHIAHKLRLTKIPKTALIIEKIHKKGYLAAKTHFKKTAIRTNIPHKELMKLLKK